MTTIGVIPARKGSKGIKNKNLAIINNKPLLQYSIDSACNSELLDHIVLTTDCPKIMRLGADLGISYIRERPAELATDEASMSATLLDALVWLQLEHGIESEVVVLLQPTSPLRLSTDIDGAIGNLTTEFDSVIAVNQVQEHPFECVEIAANGEWSYLAEPDFEVNRRQEYSKNFYYINGAIYVVRRKFFVESQRLISEKSGFYEMPRNRSVDIDYQEDLDHAEFLLGKEILSGT